ncbi:MAG: 16S rRNA (adenine(1518)-N(6)/adenine(1519)-N(6))-dimethyltransferase RsmA [Acidimicrobiia bacterium]
MVNDIVEYKEGLTISNIKKLEEQYNFYPSKALGQNFLIDINIAKKISSFISGEGNVIEIGPGLGSLTVQIATENRNVVAIEYDKHILNPLLEVLNGFSLMNYVEIINSDVMKVDLEEQCKKSQSKTIVGNLPYNISAPLIANICKEATGCEHMVAMVQKEVGERLCSPQGTRQVSAITLKCQFFMDIKMLFQVPKTAFYPAPNVDSVVIELKRKNKREVVLDDSDIQSFFSLIDAAFSQRRKTLRQSLKGFIGDKVKDVLEEAQVNSSCRAEELTLNDFKKIFKAYKNES